MLPIHRASKATIGLLSDDETIKHRHSYIDLVGTVEQVKMAEELILDKVLKVEYFLLIDIVYFSFETNLTQYFASLFIDIQ